VATFAVFYACSALSIVAVFVALVGVSVLIVPLVVLLGAWIFVLVRAAKAARQAPQPYTLQPYNRWYWYLLAVTINLFIWQPGVVRLMRSGLMQAFRIPSAAMEPTLLVGDFIFVSTLSSARHVTHKDIVVVHAPGDDRLSIVKRVVGMPGDTLAMSNGSLIRNGRLVTEPFSQTLDSAGATKQDLGAGRAWHVAHLVERSFSLRRTYRPDMRNWGPIIVPADSIFVLGDNRDNSYDSRFYGAVGIDRVVGKPMTVYFSVGDSYVRWSRIGRRF
jgi:signal peptidase I